MGKNRVYYCEDSHSGSSRDSLYAFLFHALKIRRALRMLWSSSRNEEKVLCHMIVIK